MATHRMIRLALRVTLVRKTARLGGAGSCARGNGENQQSSGGECEGSENIDDLVAGVEWVAERLVEADFVDIVAAAFGELDVAGLDEVVDDAVSGAFADADLSGDLGQANFGILGDADQNVGVVGQKRPRGHLGRLFGESTDHATNVQDLQYEARPS
jgi:hypothetical protein